MADDTEQQVLSADQVTAIQKMIADAIGTPVTDDHINSLIDAKLKDFQPVIELTDDEVKRLTADVDWVAVAAEGQARAASAQAERDEAAAAARQASQDQASKAQAQRAAAALDARNDQLASARDHYAALFGPGSTPGTADLTLLPTNGVILMLDNGETFSVDYVINPIDPRQLRQLDDRSIVLDRTLEIGQGIAEPFTVRGVDLVFGTSDALRCDLATPLTIGGGRTAQLPEGSLVFRAQPTPAPATA